MTKQYDYDVAISFLSADEPLATQLSDLLSDRYKVFVWSKKQEELAGRDGLEVYPEIFGKSARCVVVLYREGWGRTPFTQLEETAIKNRGLKEGWVFLLLAKLTPEAKTPKYLHNSYIWHDYCRFALTGLAGAVSAVIQRAGAVPRLESLSEKAARAKRKIEYQVKRDRFIWDGCETAKANVSALFISLEAKAVEISSAIPLTVRRHRQGGELAILAKKRVLLVLWRQQALTLCKMLILRPAIGPRFRQVSAAYIRSISLLSPEEIATHSICQKQMCPRGSHSAGA